jgi:hypothetical protein
VVSAIILAYNRRDEVLITIDKLKALKGSLAFDLEIVVVDNGSSDDTSGEISKKHSDVILVTNRPNNGIAGWNNGFEVAKYQYFLVLDDDSSIETGLAEAVQYMQADQTIGILALNIAGGVYETKNEVEWRDKEDCLGFIGCGAIICKEVYKKIGGFADWLYLYTHEYEYALRCMSAGFKIKFFKNSRVVHRTSNLNRSNRRLRTFSTRNECAIIYKYFPNNRWKYILRILINNLKLIKSEGVSSAWYVCQGFSKFMKMRSSLVYTPVSPEIQIFFVEKFKSVQPVLPKIYKRVLSKS